MDSLERKRKLLFLLGCIPTRLLVAYLSKICPSSYLPILGYFALLPASGFILLFITGIRTKGLGIFGEKIWWNKLRPIHSFLYFAFAYQAIHKSKNAWIYLFIDALVGLTGFLIYHYLYDKDLEKYMV